MVLGLSIHTTPVEMREKLAVPEAEWPRAIDELSNQNHIEEAGVLSTCNRFEIYVVAVSWNRGVKEVTEWMSKVNTPSSDKTPNSNANVGADTRNFFADERHFCRGFDGTFVYLARPRRYTAFV